MCGHDRLAVAIRGLQVDVDLGGVHAFGVLVELGAPGAAADLLHLGHLGDEPLGDRAHAVRFGERGARVEHEREHERAFVERRQERAREERHARRGEQRPPTAAIASSASARGNDQASSLASHAFSRATSGLSPWCSRFMFGSR